MENDSDAPVTIKTYLARQAFDPDSITRVSEALERLCAR
jgi:hypothetical protein